jgi:HAMP domain-containing protein
MRADEVKNKLSELRMTGLASLFASILLALLFALYLSRGLTRRIETLSAHCRDLSLGRLHSRISGRTFDEFDDLAATFNTMGEALEETRGNLEHAIAELKQTRDALESTVQNQSRKIEETSTSINVLRGLLPICSSCKKIRDDQGYWTQVELFVAKHSEARFTHGFCPECMVTLYGHLADDGQ